jgi:hypothetical protein
MQVMDTCHSHPKHIKTLKNNFQWLSSVHGREEGLCCSLFPLMAQNATLLSSCYITSQILNQTASVSL